MIIPFTEAERAAVAALQQRLSLELQMKLAFLAECKGIRGGVQLAADGSGFEVEGDPQH